MRYEVRVEYTETRVITVRVDADSEEQAYWLAIEKAKDTHAAEWELEDNDYEATDVLEGD